MPLPWNDGILESWNVGLKEQYYSNSFSNPLFHHSIIPIGAKPPVHLARISSHHFLSAFRTPYMIGHRPTQTNTDNTTLNKEKMSVCVCVGLQLI